MASRGKAPADSDEATSRTNRNSKGTKEYGKSFQSSRRNPGESSEKIVLLTDLMDRRIRELERRQKRKGDDITPPEQKRTCRFGKTELPILDRDDPTGFRPLTRLPVDEQQKCLLDAIWKASTRTQKLNACCALQHYFYKIMEPPLGKNYSYYGLIKENGQNFIFSKYSSLMQEKGSGRKCFWKGFYSFHEAFNYIWEYAEKHSEVFIEEEPREGPLIEVLQKEISGLNDQISEMAGDIEDLVLQLEAKQEEYREASMEPVPKTPTSSVDSRNPRHQK